MRCSSSRASSSRRGARNPTEQVMHWPSATPSWPQPGGRYSRSPGSNTASCVGSKRARIFSGSPGRSAASAGGPQRQRRRPWTWIRKTSYESTCGPTPPPSLAYETIRSSSRACGTKAKRRSSACAASSWVSSPCTSRVQPGRASGGRARRGSGPGRSDQRSSSRTTSRDSTPSRAASANSAARDSGGATPGSAWRTCSGWRCQWRRMKAAGLRPPSSAQASSMAGVIVGRIVAAAAADGCAKMAT